MGDMAMARGLLMLNLVMDMVMDMAMEDMVMDMAMEAMDMDMVAMDTMDMAMAKGLLMLNLATDMAMDTMDKKEEDRLKFHQKYHTKSLETLFMNLIFKEFSHELYLFKNKSQI